MRAFGALLVVVLSLSLWEAAVAGDPAREEAALTAAMDAFDAQEYGTARQLLEPLAKDRIEARMLMHVLYLRGLGVEESREKAWDWLDFPVDWPDTPMPNRLLALFWKHKMEVYGPETALDVFGERAAKGDAEAMYFIGDGYDSVPRGFRDYGKIAEWYRKSAEAGYAQAQAALALLYFYGDGVQKDHQKALEWAVKGALAGNVAAQSMAGNIRYSGSSNVRDVVEGYAWYRLAWLNCGEYVNGAGCPEFKEEMKAAENRLDPAQVQHGRYLAEKWRQSIHQD